MVLERLKNALFGESENNAADGGDDKLEFAAAALLVEAGNMDGRMDDAELESIQRLLARRFDHDETRAADLMERARNAMTDSVQLYPYARQVKDSLDHDARVELLEMLWEVVYADGVLDDYEANLMRRLAGLIHVPDRESGLARKRALARLGLEG